MGVSYSCIVVDDDLMSLKLMETMVQKVDVLSHKASFDSSLKAVDFLRDNKPELIFLDVEMPDLTGLEFIKYLDYKPVIILMSIKKEYAIEAFDYDVTDYLLKPVDDFSRFLKAVNKATSAIANNSNSSIEDYDQQNLFMKVDTLLYKLSLRDIQWVEAYGDFVKIHTSEKIYTVLSKFQAISEKLPQKDFVRTHRSFLVRIDKIKNIDHSNLQVQDKIIPISRSWKKQLMEKIVIL